MFNYSLCETVESEHLPRLKSLLSTQSINRFSSLTFQLQDNLIQIKTNGGGEVENFKLHDQKEAKRRREHIQSH